MNLTPHFSLEELTHSLTAVRMGIDNTLGADVLPHLVVLAQGMEQVRAVLGRPININSGYRSEELERVLCTKDFYAWCKRHGKSALTAWEEYFERKGHPKGYCADFTCHAFGAPEKIVRTIKAAGVKFDQLIEEGTWVHVSFDPRMRGETLTARFDKTGTPTYTKGIA